MSEDDKYDYDAEMVSITVRIDERILDMLEEHRKAIADPSGWPDLDQYIEDSVVGQLAKSMGGIENFNKNFLKTWAKFAQNNKAKQSQQGRLAEENQESGAPSLGMDFTLTG